MNRVINTLKRITPMRLDVNDITGNNFSKVNTAFWGKIGHCSEGKSELFLVCYSCILLADDPSQTWSNPSPISVDKWVDIDITIVEED